VLYRFLERRDRRVVLEHEHSPRSMSFSRLFLLMHELLQARRFAAVLMR
jgi:hypothetical protein